MPIEIKALDHLVVNVSDAEKSADWYERVLGMKQSDFAAAGCRSLDELQDRDRGRAGGKAGSERALISVYCRDPDGSLIEISSYTDPAPGRMQRR